jgi:uncharacterized protein YjbI with pentapeptide repeats
MMRNPQGRRIVTQVLVLALAGVAFALVSIIFLFSERGARAAREVAADNQREAVLQIYVNTMSELLEQQLRTAQAETEVRDLAHMRTFSTLRQLDGERKGLLLRFLYEAQLISTTNPRIRLDQADLRGVTLPEATLAGAGLEGANLSRANLSQANLRGANLRHADLHAAHLRFADLRGAFLQEADLREARLSFADLRAADLRAANLRESYLRFATLRNAILVGADLTGVDLIGADLTDVDLTGAILQRAILSGANLSGADLSGTDLTDAVATPEQVAMSKSLEGATLPDGSKYD